MSRGSPLIRPIGDAVADAVACSFAIYYHPRLGEALAEFARVSRPGGRLAISGPAAGTNQELYAFHRLATGAGPSDADTMAQGYVQGPVAEGLAADGRFSGIETAVHTNHIRFPDAGSFLDYWRATSRFARTPSASVERGRAALASLQGERAGQPAGGITVTKRVAILAALRR